MILEKKTEVKNQMPEKEYRSLRERLSYSNLKTYVQSRSRFYRECILGDTREDEKSLSTIIGDITHSLLANNSEFDSKFHICTAIQPVGQVLELCDALYKRAVKGMRIDDDGKYVQTESFEILFNDAVNSVKYDRDMKEVKFVGKNMEKILQLFTEPDKKGAVGELYYKETLSCIGKQIVTVSQIQSGERLVEQLKNHEYTRDIVNQQSENGIEVFNELVILYEIDGVMYRSMIDKLIVDHNKKLITPYDYKCTFDVEGGWEYSYLKHMYHIQCGLYDMAIWHWKREHGLEYKVGAMNYIACDTTGQNAPVVYKLTAQDIEMAKHGFKVRGKYYPGVLEIMQSIQWNLSSGIWSTSKEIHANNGVMNMDIKYEK